MTVARTDPVTTAEGGDLGTTLARAVVSVAQLDRSREFYAGILALSVIRDLPGIAWLAAGGVEVLLHERPPSPSDTAVAVCFGVPRLAPTVEAWRDAGGEIVRAPTVQDWGEVMALVRDPDGHLVCLVERA